MLEVERQEDALYHILWGLLRDGNVKGSGDVADLACLDGLAFVPVEL